MLPEPVRQVGLPYDRWRHHRSPPRQFRHGTGGEGNNLQPPALVVSAATTNRTFGPIDLTNTYYVCTWTVFGGIGHRTQAFRYGLLVYADKPQKLDHLEDNIRRVIADIRPQMLEKVIENWTSRLDYIRASRGSPMPEIIFKM
ncbi:uncharacterized protein TNCV_361121 [Trichonephila clavipes]|nr:uncharacterized protein TNCV_361121 [Trichonephila clavipes]